MLHRIRAVAALAVLVVLSACADSPRRVDLVTGPLLSTLSPTLLECPPAASSSASGLLGVLGGSVETQGNRITLPIGAVSLPTLLRVEVPSSTLVEIDVTANDLLRFVFHRPVSITIDYSRCPHSATAGKALTVYHIDTETKALLEHMGGVDDPVRRRITFTTSHLSGYAIAQ